FSKQRSKQKYSFGRALLTPDECARLPQNKSIIIKNGHPPILGDKVPYYIIRDLAVRANIAPPKSDTIHSKEPLWFEKFKAFHAQKEKSKPIIKTKQQSRTKRAKKGQGELFPWIQTTNDIG